MQDDTKGVGTRDRSGDALTTEPEQVRFDAFVLDFARCTLSRGGVILPLRPKSFDVLCNLIASAGRVVPKEELFEKVWPGVSVTDDSLVQCIKEIRRALDDTEHRLLKTLPKRGYLLDAAVDPGLARSGDVQVRERMSSPAAAWWLVRLRGFLPAPVSPLRTIVLACAVGGILSIVAFVASLGRDRPRAPNESATHFALLGTATLDHERTQKANREALALFDKALARDPDHVLALVGYARAIVMDVTEGWAPLQERAMRLDQAESALLRALARDPDDSRAHHIYGHLWRARAEPERAIHHLERSLRAHPTKAWVLADLGRSRIEAGEPRQAIGDFEAAIRLTPDEPYIYIWYFQAGMAAVHASDPDAALQWLRKSELASPVYHRHIMLWRAVALAELGREMEARTLVGEYLAPASRFTVATWLTHFASRNATVVAQRARIADVLRRLGVPSGDQNAGLVR